jgi:hypothetical protein
MASTNKKRPYRQGPPRQPATHRVRWQVWTGLVEHGSHASGYSKRKQPKPQSRDFISETEARNFVERLRQQHGGPDQILIHIEALMQPRQPSQPALTDVAWPPAVRKLT